METFPKTERLCGRAAITNLLWKGRFGHAGALKYCYLVSDDSSSSGANRLMVSVSKRFFKRAVRRNLLKRRLREAFRRRKDLLAGVSGCDIAIIYNTSEVLSYSALAADVETVLRNISSGR